MELYEHYYRDSPFVFVSPQSVDVKQVVNTNKCFLHLEVHEGQILISSVIDNLIKGASGQAVQNMNLMLGWDETAGLKLKAANF
jgi:N-acetyl-gamma-glutamyl-phosphate reductase